MKLFILSLLFLSLLSCKKDYTCECKGYINQFKGTTNLSFKPWKRYYTINTTKTKAKCDSYIKEVNYYSYRTVEVERCELK